MIFYLLEQIFTVEQFAANFVTCFTSFYTTFDFIAYNKKYTKTSDKFFKTEEEYGKVHGLDMNATEKSVIAALKQSLKELLQNIKETTGDQNADKVNINAKREKIVQQLKALRQHYSDNGGNDAQYSLTKIAGLLSRYEKEDVFVKLGAIINVQYQVSAEDFKSPMGLNAFVNQLFDDEEKNKHHPLYKTYDYVRKIALNLQIEQENGALKPKTELSKEDKTRFIKAVTSVAQTRLEDELAEFKTIISPLKYKSKIQFQDVMNYMKLPSIAYGLWYLYSLDLTRLINSVVDLRVFGFNLATFPGMIFKGYVVNLLFTTLFGKDYSLINLMPKAPKDIMHVSQHIGEFIYHYFQKMRGIDSGINLKSLQDIIDGMDLTPKEVGILCAELLLLFAVPAIIPMHGFVTSVPLFMQIVSYAAIGAVGCEYFVNRSNEIFNSAQKMIVGSMKLATVGFTLTMCATTITATGSAVAVLGVAAVGAGVVYALSYLDVPDLDAGRGGAGK